MSAAPAPLSSAPAGEARHTRLRRMSDREPEREIARLEADAARGRVVVYLPPEDPATG